MGQHMIVCYYVMLCGVVCLFVCLFVCLKRSHRLLLPDRCGNVGMQAKSMDENRQCVAEILCLYQSILQNRSKLVYLIFFKNRFVLFFIFIFIFIYFYFYFYFYYLFVLSY